MAYDNMGDLSGRSYYSTNGISYNNGLSEYGDCNIRAKVSTETFVKTNGNSYIPTKVKLHPNFPNPFNSSTRITFNIPSNDYTRIYITDIEGRLVKLLFEGLSVEGTSYIDWDGTNENGFDASSGVYFYSLQTNSRTQSKKMSFVR